MIENENEFELEILSLKNQIFYLEEKLNAMNKGNGACVLDSQGIPCYDGDKIFVQEIHSKEDFNGIEEDVVEFDNCTLFYDAKYRMWKYKTEFGLIGNISNTVLSNGYNYLGFRKIKEN